MLQLHTYITWALMGLIWHVQLVQYPLLLEVGKESFGRYHFGHCVRISVLVLPLILLEVLTAAWLVWNGRLDSLFLASLVLMGVAWFSTFVFQARIHSRLLTTGRSEDLIRQLVLTNWFRTVAWTARAGMVGWICLP